MRVVSSVTFVCVLYASLALTPAVCVAQTGPVSDSLEEIIKDLNPTAAAVLPAPKSYLISELPGEPTEAVFDFPAHEIDFREAVGANSQFSDRLSVGRYQVRVASDDDPGGLPPRTSADVIRIPASALESFRPFTITAHSDGELTGVPTQASDRLTIAVGSFATSTGTTIFDMPIIEPTPEGATEPVLDFDMPALALT